MRGNTRLHFELRYEYFIVIIEHGFRFVTCLGWARSWLLVGSRQQKEAR
jgi:hypothetical protein